MKNLIILVLLLVGCSTLNDGGEHEVRKLEDPNILGMWYHHIGRDDFVALKLMKEGRFNVSVYSCNKNKFFSQAGGSWSLKENAFRLKWPDRTKEQTLHFVSKEKLVLLNAPKRAEYYFRVPKFTKTDKLCRVYQS